MSQLPPPGSASKTGVRIWPGSLLAHVTVLVGSALLLMVVLAFGMWLVLSKPRLTGPLPPTAAPS